MAVVIVVIVVMLVMMMIPDRGGRAALRLLLSLPMLLSPGALGALPRAPYMPSPSSSSTWSHLRLTHLLLSCLPADHVQPRWP